MKKTAEEIYNFYIGKLDALSTMGMSKKATMYLLQSDGLKKEAAEYLIKEANPLAVAPLLSKGLAGAGKFLATRGGAMARKAIPTAAGQATTAGQFARQAAGRLGTRAGSGLISSAKNIHQKGLLPSIGGGLAETGKGFLFAQGKGLGGTLGKGLFGLQTVATLGNILGSSNQSPPMYNQY